MNIEFSKSTNPTLFQAFVNAIEYVCENHQTRNQGEVINIIQQELGVRLIRHERGEGDTATKWTAHFVDDKVYVWFLLRWA